MLLKVSKTKLLVNIVGLVVVFFLGMVVGSKWPLSISIFSSPTNQAIYQYSFSGEGRDTVGPFTLADGLVFITIRNQASANDYLGVNIYFDEDGDKQRSGGDDWVEQLVNVAYEDAENFDGTMPLKASAGDYFIDIDGARWQIEIFQPVISDKPADKFVGAQGNGPKVTEMFYLDKGEYKFKVTNNGGSNFIVYLVDDRGNFSRRLVNEIGEYDGEFSVEVVMPGNYLFYVYSNGDWQIDPLA